MRVRLLDIAHARSGDKGDTANVGVIANKAAWYPVLRDNLSVDRVAARTLPVSSLGPSKRYMSCRTSRRSTSCSTGRSTAAGRAVPEDRRPGQGLLDGALADGSRCAERRGEAPRAAASTGLRLAMTPLTTWQAVIGVAGLAAFGYGVRTNSPTIRWVGIGLLVAAFAIRFVKLRVNRRSG